VTPQEVKQSAEFVLRREATYSECEQVAQAYLDQSKRLEDAVAVLKEIATYVPRYEDDVDARYSVQSMASDFLAGKVSE